MKNTLEQTLGRCERFMACEGEIIEKTEDKTVIKNMRDTEKAEQLFTAFVLNYKSLDEAEKIWGKAGCGREGIEIDEAKRIEADVVEQWKNKRLISAEDGVFDYFAGPKAQVLSMILSLSKKKDEVVETIIREANAVSALPVVFDVLDYFVANSCSETAVRLVKELGGSLYKNKSFSKTPEYTSTDAAVRLYRNALLSGAADKEFTKNFIRFAEKCEVYSDSSMGSAFTYPAKKESFKRFINALKNNGREAVLDFNAGLESNFSRQRKEYAKQSAAMKEAVDLTKIVRLCIPECIRETELGNICLQKGLEYIQGRRA